jgi:hypothetical protein
LKYFVDESFFEAIFSSQQLAAMGHWRANLGIAKLATGLNAVLCAGTPPLATG